MSFSDILLVEDIGRGLRNSPLAVPYNNQAHREARADENVSFVLFGCCYYGGAWNRMGRGIIFCLLAGRGVRINSVEHLWRHPTHTHT